MCDCAVTRVVVDASGVPLDLGRTQRLFSGEQRRAIIVRDRECIWPGCHQHARWCEIHHRVWWERDGGRTSVDDGVLMCTFHHHETHRLDLAVVRLLGAVRGGPPGGGPPGGGRSGGGPPGRRRTPGSGLTSVGYEFRDPTGRLLGMAPPGVSTAPTPRRAAHVAGEIQEAAPARDRVPRTGTPGSDGRVPQQVDGPVPAKTDSRRVSRAGGGSPPDELDLGWTTDPHTGVRVPAFPPVGMSALPG
jgi:hypothetical protein